MNHPSQGEEDAPTELGCAGHIPAWSSSGCGWAVVLSMLMFSAAVIRLG